jgi:hypothetical protein
MKVPPTSCVVDDAMKSWRVVGNGGHPVDPRLSVKQNPQVLENRSRVKGHRVGNKM